MDTLLFLDVVVAILLVITIVYAFLLNRRLKAFRRDRGEMEAFIKALNEATARAEAVVKQLKHTASEANGTVHGSLEKAQSLREDLRFLLDRGTTVADRLEKRLRDQRPNGDEGEALEAPMRPSLTVKKEPASEKAGDAEGRSEAERELMRALQTVR
ncbi:MAG: DUF6468 domain-containing protein [Magnetospiraceae bacterium]